MIKLSISNFERPPLIFLPQHHCTTPYLQPCIYRCAYNPVQPRTTPYNTTYNCNPYFGAAQ